MIDLKPCPFCGGQAERIDLDEDEADPNYGGSFIHCPDCLASSKLIFGEKVGLEEAWNNRQPAPSAEPGALREVAQVLLDAYLCNPDSPSEFVAYRGGPTVIAEWHVLRAALGKEGE